MKLNYSNYENSTMKIRYFQVAEQPCPITRIILSLVLLFLTLSSSIKSSMQRGKKDKVSLGHQILFLLGKKKRKKRHDMITDETMDNNSVNKHYP